MKKTLEILPPSMPNFVTTKQEPGKRQDGFKHGMIIDIADFTEDEANEFAELMKQEFIKHYNERKARKTALRELTK